MKRTIAILLILVMVLPMCLIAKAEETTTEIRPYYLLNWSPIPDSVQGDNAYHLYSLWTRIPKADTTELYVIAKDYGIGNDIAAIAAGMKQEFDSRPVGTRYMMITDRLEENVENYVFLDKGVSLLKNYLEKLYSELHRIGGTLDGLILDMEYNEYSAYNLDKVYQDDPFVYKKIVEDPRYQERIRPLLEERGFVFWPNPNDYQPEIYSINEKAGDEYEHSRAVWGTALHELMVEYINEACSPLYTYYPNANLSNYRSYAAAGWVKTIDNRGNVLATGGNMSYVGNTTNENAYFYKPADVYFKEGNTSMLTFKYPITYNKTHLDATKFNTFLWDLNIFKNMMMASDTENMSPWVVRHDYTADVPYSGCNSPYYTETYLHIGMMNPMHFLGYVTNVNDQYATSVQILSDIMSELTRVGGAADRKYIKMPHNWNYSFALTGMYAGGRNIWRITPDTTYVSKDEFLVEGKDPTFRINGQTVTFPGGKIIEDGKITKVGSCGYWVETAADVMPVIVSDTDRYKMHPAFSENFESYEAGMEYSYNNVTYVSSWQVKKGKTATAVVQVDANNADNKVLAITGDYNLKNTRVVKNVTAGDTYAEDQAWEVAVTIPADMGADAEVILLAIYGDKNKPIDGGFKITGGKLYYYNGEMYVEAEGIDVSKGGKFTFVRNMNFNNPDVFICDYTVYNESGKEAFSAKKVAVAKDVKIPVETIGFDFSKISGDPVLMDDYKLYATGVTTDFELYDAKLGLKLTELDKARDSATAYRLAWMNATAYEHIYSVVAAFYEGETLVFETVIKQIKMGPNTDAIETGVVEVEDGQSVYIYVRNDSKTFVSPEERTRAVMVAVIVGVFVLAVVVAVLVIVVCKKKKTVPAEEITEGSAE